MTARIVSVLAFGFFLPAALPAAEPAKGSPYLPDALGSRWTYKMEIGKPGAAPSLTSKAVAQIVKHESLDGTDCSLIETTADGEVVREHVGAKPDGLYRFTLGGRKADPAILYLKLPVKKGEAWTAKSDVGGQAVKVDYKLDEGEVEVAGKGKQKAVIVTGESDADGKKVVTTSWYVAGTGLVQQTTVFGERQVTLKLETFEPGKGR